MRYLIVLLLATAGLLGWALHSGRLVVPPPWNPWAPLDIAAEPNWLTRHKMRRLDSDPALCRAVLAGAAIAHAPMPDNDPGDGCGWRDAVRVDDPRFAPAFTLSCTAAVSLALWERHDLQVAAMIHLGQRVARVEHLGSYACRNVRGAAGEGAHRSQHAMANALDVSGFRLADGSRVRVLTHWPDDGSEARFLREVRDGACRFFDGVLSPDHNAAHRDHFHLDRGAFRLCR
jgi:hypothetical protein